MLGGGHEILNRLTGRHHSAGDVVEKTGDAEWTILIPMPQGTASANGLR